ncbi:MAG: MFS transporter [Acidimicrobiia bacterium]
MTSTDAPTKARTPLGSSYRKLFGASVISNLGDGVGTVAYPWLASAVTRNPLLISLVPVAGRLPWLVFSLPAGVITDRVDRRRAMVGMDACRFVLAAVVALAVLARQGSLPGPDEVAAIVGTEWVLYVTVVIATLFLGMAEVLRDNAAQTILPAIVPAAGLERANGRMWSAEGVANTFAGPPLGSLLLAASFALPFIVDAATFLAGAVLVAMIPGSFRADRPDDPAPAHWRAELREGVGWLWRHELLRPMAIILGVMNAAGMVSFATFVLFAQEVLGVGPLLFTVLGMGGALGGIVGGTFASAMSRRLGSGTCLGLTLAGSAIVAAVIAVTSWWPVVFVMFTAFSLLGILWNVITVSLRQTIIPPHLLGRVNSVYRFFAWGMMPVGAALGGGVVVVVDTFASRDVALRATWVVNGAIHALLFAFGRRKLTTAKIEAARTAERIDD